ncbi:MAG: PRC-barrel domain-containing protein [Candidatus Aenigmarchaeota archaeon]|nr:PRC-barrel domain-containing protein [Candidatus Aenigmarchaeota archaeon]
MVVTVKNLSEIFNKEVFTNRGVFCGKVADIEVNLSKFRINSIVVETGRGSFLADMVGGKKGVVVPYQLVTSVGDVVIIKHITPTMSENSEEIESTAI